MKRLDNYYCSYVNNCIAYAITCPNWSSQFKTECSLHANVFVRKKYFGHIIKYSYSTLFVSLCLPR